MIRPTFAGAILALVTTPVGVMINSQLHKDTPNPESMQLTQELVALNGTLAGFETRQRGSEEQLTNQLVSLTNIVSQTKAASDRQIAQLTDSLKQLQETSQNQLAAAQAEKSEFQKSLDALSKTMEQKVEIAAQQINATTEGVGTLDVNNAPSSDEELRSIQTLTDAARRIIALEREVAALKARSAVSSTQAATYYSTPTYTNGGGCTGTYQTNSLASPVQYYEYSQPYQQYSQPTSSQYMQTSTQRRGLFGRFSRGSVVRSSGTCSIVNGVQVCN